MKKFVRVARIPHSPDIAEVLTYFKKKAMGKVKFCANCKKPMDENSPFDTCRYCRMDAFIAEGKRKKALKDAQQKLL